MNEDRNASKTASEETSNEDGEKVSLWEYALLLVLIAIVVVVAMLFLQPIEQQLLY